MAEMWAAFLTWLKTPVELPAAILGWIAAGLGAGVLLTLLVVYIVRLVRRRRERKAAAAAAQAPQPQAESGIAVEKLHEQGARKSQQDCFFVSPPEQAAERGLLAVVADGMGGLSDGDKVSQAAVSAMAESFYLLQGTPEQVLLELLARANQAVTDLLGYDGLCRSGSTLVAGLIREGLFHYLSVGDSRICLYRDGTLWQLNREHVFREELYLRAVNRETSLQEAAQHPQAAGLTSFLGMGQLKYVDRPAQPVAVRAGDRFLLMSDGVYNALTEQELTGALDRGGGQAAGALGELIAAKGYTNQDNYTAVILTC